MTKHFPTFEQVQCVADTFYMIAETVGDEGEVRMMKGEIPQGDTVCGTSACHAGWWRYFSTLNDAGKYENFSSGALKLAQALGFESENDLVQWAVNHPVIWGNMNACFMFTCSKAFNFPSHLRSITLRDIAKHWQRVAINVATGQ